MADLNEQLIQAWPIDLDHERSVALARPFMEGVRDGVIDPVPRLETLENAFEPLIDADGGDPALALSAVSGAQPAFRHAEEFGGLKHPARLYYRGRPWTMLVRGLHCANCPKDAMLSAVGLLTWVEDVAGGAEALRVLVARAEPNSVADLAVSAVGIYGAVVRRVPLPPHVREFYVSIGRDLVRAYAFAKPAPVPYPRTPALAAQWLFLLIENDRNGIAEDPLLITALYQLDVAYRADHARAQATVELREFEMTRWRGEVEAAERHRHAAADNLVRFPRHRRRLEGLLAA